jgi:hypothetical protein
MKKERKIRKEKKKKRKREEKNVPCVVNQHPKLKF